MCPTAIDTPPVDATVETYGTEAVGRLGAIAGPFNIFEPGTNLEPEAVSEALMWRSSDAARNVTGVALPVDAGFTPK